MSGCQTTDDPQNVTKDPNDNLDFATSWVTFLPEDDTITVSLWIVPDGITKTNENLDDKVATIWLSGGTLGTTYEVVNRITTAQGRIKDRTKFVYIEEQ